MASQTFSGFNVPQKWGQKTNYQGGQGGQLVTHALVTWRAIRPRNGIPPGTISGQWEQVPATITSPNVAQAVQAALPPPKPIAPKVVVTGSRPVNVSSNNVSVSVFQGSGDSAFSGLVPAPPNIAGTALFLREDGTWAAPGGGGGGVTSVGLALPAEFTVSGSPVTTSGTLTGAWASENNNVVFAGPAVVPGTPTFRALVFADLPAGVGTVTSVGVSSDASYLTVGATPVTTSGTITVNKTTGLAANRFVATPSGAPGTADLRAIVPSDLAGTPGAGKYWDGAGSGAWTALPAPGTGTVTSVAMSVPSFLSVAGSPVTTSGIFVVTLVTENANTIFAGPTTGIAATPTFRSMVAADLPNTAVTPGSYTYSSITVDAQGRLTSASSGAAPTGTVTSVALSMPSFLTVSGSPVTTSGTLTAVLANQNANLVFAGPSSGAAAAPTFRNLVGEDVASNAATINLTLQAQGAGVRPLWVSSIVALGILSDGPYSVAQGFDMNSQPNSFDVPGLAGAVHTGITGVAATDIITDNAHGYANGTRVIFSAITGGAGLAVFFQYYVVSATTNTYQLSATIGGAVLNFTTNITAGSINSVASLAVTIPAGSPFTKWAVFWDTMVTLNSANTSRSLRMAIVKGTNVNIAPGNSALLWPANYVSNTGGGWYIGSTVDVSNASIPLQGNISGAIVNAVAGDVVKVVFGAANIFTVQSWQNRELTLIPVA